jgi:diguanylate cyclase (GGDEF)-like protein
MCVDHESSSWLTQRVRLALCFLLFIPTALILVFYPPEEPGWIPWHGLPIYNLAAWLVCLACLILMGRVANSVKDDLPFAVTRYLLFSFLFFFAVERFLAFSAGRAYVHWLASTQKVQLFSSLTVAVGAAVVLPHLRSMMEGSATARKEHDRFLASAESSLDDFYIFDGVPDASGKIVDFRFSYINPNAERRLNVRRESLIGKILTEVRPFMVSSGLIEKYIEVVRTGVPFTCEVFVNDEMIKATWLNVQVVRLGDGIAITSRDVTESKRLTDHVKYLAHHDQLTGLANRTLLHDRLDQAILRAQRHSERVAVFMLDIDHFKRINDSLGHADGDALLAIVAQRLRSSVRETDTIARMGGDEFVIVMPECKSLEDVRRCGQQIVNSAATPIILGNREIQVTLSVGLAIYPDDCFEADQLLKNADAAMYVVKETGRNGLHVFNEGMLEESADELKLEAGQYVMKCPDAPTLPSQWH